MKYTPDNSWTTFSPGPMLVVLTIILTVVTVVLLMAFFTESNSRGKGFSFLAVVLLPLLTIGVGVAAFFTSQDAFEKEPLSAQEVFFEQIEDRYGVKTTLGEVELLLKIEDSFTFFGPDPGFSPADVTYEEYGKAYVVLDGEPVEVQLVKVLDTYKLVFSDSDGEPVEYDELPVKQ